MNTTRYVTEEAIARRLLSRTPLKVCDSARITLEALEDLGAMAHGKGKSELLRLLRRVLHYGVQAVMRAEQTVTLEEAAWASVEARQGLRPSSRRDLRHFVRRILRTEGVRTLALRSITSDQCRLILKNAFGSSRSSYVKGRVILHSIFTYGMRREWCDSNPVARIEVPTVDEKPISPLRPEEVSKLCQTCDLPPFRSMRFSLHLMLYCGIRPAEVQRLKRDDVFWDEKLVLIRPQASKTGGGRIVPLRCAQRLSAEECTVPKNWQRRWQELRKAAGFNHWAADVCRHTFASYHAAYYRDLGQLQLEMGHRDCNLLRCRYMSPVLRREAERFWRFDAQRGG